MVKRAYEFCPPVSDWMARTRLLARSNLIIKADPSLSLCLGFLHSSIWQPLLSHEMLTGLCQGLEGWLRPPAAAGSVVERGVPRPSEQPSGYEGLQHSPCEWWKQSDSDGFAAKVLWRSEPFTQQGHLGPASSTLSLWYELDSLQVPVWGCWRRSVM